MNSMILQIPLDDIAPFPGNRRVGGFDQEKLEQLAASIRDIGVQQPAIVRKGTNGTAYELIAGERRWRASRIAGAETLPCLVKELTDAQALKVQLVENLQRDDVHPLDECHGFADLLDTGEYDVATLSKEVGRSPSYIYQRIKLRELTADAEKALLEGEISVGHALLIARLPEDLQATALEFSAEEYNDGRATVRELASYIERELMLELARAAFQKDDADLVPAAGPCTMCPKRTGRQPELFGDIASDRCMDAACFNGKLDALVEQQRAELEAEGADYFEASISYSREKGVAASWEWSECRKKDPGARRVLVSVGPERGRVTWGRLNKDIPKDDLDEEKTEEEREWREKRAAKELEQDVLGETNRRAWKELLSKLEIDAKGAFFSEPALRLICEAVFDRQQQNYQVQLLKRYGWERAEIEQSWGGTGKENPSKTYRRGIARVDSGVLERTLLEAALVHTLAFDYFPHDVEDLSDTLGRRICDAFRIPVPEIERQVRAELEAKRERKR